MESKNTEEIICTNCGRPNLPEAVKCWYCQIPLKTEEEENQASSEYTEPETHKPHKPDQHAKVYADNEDIPDWLKRIREMKEEERAKEEERDQWQQRDLFSKSDRSEDAATREKKRHGKASGKSQRPAPKVKKTASQSKPDINKDTEPKEKNKPSAPAKKDEPELDIPPEDLPDGFVKFDSKNS